MAGYTFVSANNSGTGAGSPTLALTISAGQSLIILAVDNAISSETLTISDTLGNTYSVRGTMNDTFDSGTRTLIDCLAPITGSTTLTLAGSSGANAGGILALVYTGIAAYSAGSFTHAFAATPTVATDGLATSAISATSYAAMLVSFCAAASTTVMTQGTGFSSRYATATGMAGANAGYAEDLELLSGSHIASWTPGAGASSASVIGATYIESSLVTSAPIAWIT